MEKDSFELSTGLAAETGHCDNASQIPTETTSPPLQALPGGYDVSRFNALRHGVLSAHTVLPGENKAEYEALLSALAQEHAPHGPTEEHLVEEIAGIIWRKRRLRLAEAASYRGGLETIANPSSSTVKRALLKVDPIIDALTGQAGRTTEDFSELKRRQVLAGCGKTRRLEKIAQKSARNQKSGPVKSMGYRNAEGHGLLRKQHRPTFSATC